MVIGCRISFLWVSGIAIPAITAPLSIPSLVKPLSFGIVCGVCVGGSSVESQLSNSSVGYLLQACSVVSEESRSSSSRPRGGVTSVHTPGQELKGAVATISGVYARV